MSASKPKQLPMSKGIAAALLVFASVSAMLSSAANANTAANAIIRNSVTVTFADANNNAQPAVTSTVDISVNLVPTAALIAQVTADATIAPNGTQAYTYSITSAANGPDDYTMTPTLGADGTPSSALTPASASNTVIPLGATLSAESTAAVVIAASGGTGDIFVPADGSGNAALLNGLQVNDIVVVDGVELRVATIISNPTTPVSGAVTLAEITLENNSLTPVTVDYGDLIAERKTFTVSVDPGTYTGPGDKTIVHTVDVTDGANASAQITTTTTVAGLTVTVTKYVRNVNSSIVGTTPIAVNGTTYYASGVNANPGQTLEYLIVVENALNSSAANNVVISDGIPAFTNYVGSSMKLVPSIAIATLPGAAAFVGQTDAGNSDAGETDNAVPASVTQVSIYAGTGGSDTTNVGGSLAGGQRTYGLFQVTVE